MSTAHPPVKLFIAADPGLPADLAEDLVDDLSADGFEHDDITVLSRRLPADHRGEVRVDDVTRELSDQPHHLLVCLTDQPERIHRQPVCARIDASKRTVVVSVPTFGVLRVRNRTRRAVVQLVRRLTGTADGPISVAGTKFRLVENEASDQVRYVDTSRLGALRLLTGMVFANRPWRLVVSLKSSLVAGIGTMGSLVITPTIWMASGSMGALRLLSILLFSVALMTAWLVVGHRMWEKPDDLGDAGLARLYNASTLMTVVIGVGIAYFLLFVAGAATAQTLLDAHVIGSQTSEHPSMVDRLSIACLVASMATVASALGSGLDSDEAVYQAAYGHRHQARRRAIRQQHRDAQPQNT